MRKESIHAWAVERGKKRNWEGEIRSFEIGVFKDIEYQIRQVLHLNNEDFTIFHRINILTIPRVANLYQTYFSFIFLHCDCIAHDALRDATFLQRLV